MACLFCRPLARALVNGKLKSFEHVLDHQVVHLYIHIHICILYIFDRFGTTIARGLHKFDCCILINS